MLRKHIIYNIILNYYISGSHKYTHTHTLSLSFSLHFEDVLGVLSIWMRNV